LHRVAFHQSIYGQAALKARPAKIGHRLNSIGLTK
jgi:hypothetical protein